MKTIDPLEWKQNLPAFAEKTRAFYAGELDRNAYKGFSGYYGSYAQKGGAASLFETLVNCIGAATCRVGVRDFQALLAASVAACGLGYAAWAADPQAIDRVAAPFLA